MLSQTIYIWILNISLFIHTKKSVLVYKSLQDEISFVLVFL